MHTYRMQNTVFNEAMGTDDMVKFKQNRTKTSQQLSYFLEEQTTPEISGMLTQFESIDAPNFRRFPLNIVLWVTLRLIIATIY